MTFKENKRKYTDEDKEEMLEEFTTTSKKQ
jgi:hypothetical protein